MDTTDTERFLVCWNCMEKIPIEEITPISRNSKAPVCFDCEEELWSKPKLKKFPFKKDKDYEEK